MSPAVWMLSAAWLGKFAIKESSSVTSKGGAWTARGFMFRVSKQWPNLNRDNHSTRCAQAKPWTHIEPVGTLAFDGLQVAVHDRKLFEEKCKLGAVLR